MPKSSTATTTLFDSYFSELTSLSRGPSLTPLWAEIGPILATLKNKAGSPPELSDRQFIEAVLYLARTGLPWRDLPAEFGHWDAVYNRFRRWEARGIWRQLWAHLQTEVCEAASHVFVDSTIVRRHQHAAGGRKKTVGRRHRLWAALGADSPPTFTPVVSMRRPVLPWS
jgi:transposase